MTRRRWGRSLPRRAAVVGILAGGLALAAGAVIAADLAPGDPGTCNRGTAGAASVAFELADGPDLWNRIPNMGRAPELESVQGQITVVVFEGPHRSVPIVGQLQPRGQAVAEAPSFNNVVCVVSPSGEEAYYVDVNLSGLNLSGLAVDRRDP